MAKQGHARYRFGMIHLSLRPAILIILLWLAGLGAAAQFAKIAVPFADFYALYPDVGPGFGWLLSIISVVGVFLGMTAGILAAKLGYVRLLVLGILLGAGMSFWQAVLPGFPAMLTSRLIEGFSHLIIVVIAPTLIAQFSPDRFRGAAMALWSTFFGVSFVIVAWIGLPFMALHGPGGLLLAHAIYMVVVAGCLAIAFRVFDVHLPKSKISLNITSILLQHIKAYQSPNISAPAIGWLFYTLTFVSLMAIIPITLPAESRMVIVGLLPLVSIGTSLVVVSFLITLISSTTIVIAGFALAAIVVLLGLSGIPPTIVWVGLFVVLGLIQGASFTAIVQLNSSTIDRAMANGAMAQMGNLGNALGTPILLAILSVFGITGMLLAVSGLYVMGGMAHVYLSLKRRSKA